MNPVLPRSVWSLLVEQGGRFAKARIRMTFVVERVEEGFAHGLLESGERHAIGVRVLARGLRGARPIDQKPRAPKLTRLDGPAEKRAPRETKPQGLQPQNEKYAAALAMRKAGKSLKEIAEAFDTKTGNVSNWLTRARDAEQDEKTRRAS